MLELTVRLIVSLAIVVGLLLVLARFGARKFRGNSSALVHVVHRQPLSRSSSVAVVTVGSRVLVLGTTEHQVSVLAELDPEELAFTESSLRESSLEELGLEPTPEPVLKAVREPARGSHRAFPRPQSPAVGPLAGSVLSPQTWRQAFGVRRAS
jgi:flagellar protein FliO/FliZ